MDDQDLPIDIHAPKLLDWLVSRRDVKKDWSAKVRTVREKINAAIQDMPEHPEITKLLSGTYISYFHCLKIVDILKETEKDTKNILGWYGSQRMKDWQEVVYLYEKDNVYLAEAAQLLIRNIKFEIPELRQQISKGSAALEECDRKVREYTNTAEENRKRYYASCKQIGIAGDKIKQELVDLLKELPGEFAKVAEEAKSLSGAREMYLDFLTYTMGEDDHRECLPLLKFIMEHGNVTTYEWLYGEAPCSIEEPQMDIDIEDDTTEQSDEIDFGDMGGTIDFGSDIDMGVEMGEAGDIDWGNLDAGDAQDIDWGIAEGEGVGEAVDIEVEESGVAGGVARGTDALTLLHNEKTRNDFINELYELKGFLQQRHTELTSDDSCLLVTQFISAMGTGLDQNSDQVAELVTRIQAILDSLATTKMLHLFLISSTPRYVNRLAESLRSKLAAVDKVGVSVEAVKARKERIAQEQREVFPRLQLIIDRTKEMKTDVERQISKRYKNRLVNIMGANLNTTV